MKNLAQRLLSQGVGLGECEKRRRKGRHRVDLECGAGERLRAQQKEGRMVGPTHAEPKWTAPREAGQPAAYVGLDAFSVPMQGAGATSCIFFQVG